MNALSCYSILLSAALLELPAARLETLSGERVEGQLKEINDATVTLSVAEAPRSIPVTEILQLELTPATPATPVQPTEPAAEELHVALHDGTKLAATKFEIKSSKVRFESALVGPLQAPVAGLSYVRFASGTAKAEEAWTALLQKESKRDVLVIRKGDVIDHLTGVIGDVGTKVNFLLDGEDVPVSREKVFGLIYARRTTTAPKPKCQVYSAQGDVLPVSRLSWDGKSLEGRLLSGTEVKIPIEKVQTLDYSLGKLRYLSQMEPREVKYVPFFDVTWTYRRDRNLEGGPIRVGGKTYERGLALHSRTLLRYRLGGEFRRFQTVMGIDQTIERHGNVHVVISGDGKTLHESDVRVKDAPVPLDLDITGVRDLEILVDFGADLKDTGDRLDLADAKVKK